MRFLPLANFPGWPLCLSLTLFVLLTISGVAAPPNADQGAPPQSQATPVIPAGTILAARFNQTVSSKNATPGQPILARIMQDVPLPGGHTIPAGTKLLGKILEVQSFSSGSQGKITLRFDTLRTGNQSIAIVASLRAIAGFMDVLDAQTPEFSPGFGTPGPWITTRQIGGDEVYGLDGPVTNQWSERVGTSVQGGVLVHVRASEGSPCRGPLRSEDPLQALWVFSADACGVYGLAHVRIAHAGRSDPIGAFSLVSDARDLKLRSGDAILLRTH